MDFQEYIAADGLNWSTLKGFFRSPAHVKQYLDEQSIESGAQRLGTLQHMAILEPERFAAECIAMPDFGHQRKTETTTAEEGKRNKEARKAWLANNVGKTVVPNAEYHQLVGMSKAIFAHEDAARILKLVDETEKPVFWKDKGVQCKGLIDIYSRRGAFIGDIKTTGKDARFFGFQHEAAKHHYYGQAAYYLRACDALDIPAKNFIWIVVETKAPHGVACYTLSDVTRSSCNVLIDEFMGRWIYCAGSDNWPNYNDPIQPLDAPESYFRKIENQ
jgi:hypothetical protein